MITHNIYGVILAMSKIVKDIDEYVSQKTKMRVSSTWDISSIRKEVLEMTLHTPDTKA